MKVQTNEYDRMRAWFAHMVPVTFPPHLLTPENHPIVVLDAIAARFPSKARDGLSMAINDIIEATQDWPAEQVVALDFELTQAGLPSLTDARRRFSKAVQRAVRRGHIKDEVEYHAIRNAAEVLNDGEALWALLAAYEQAAAGKVG